VRRRSEGAIDLNRLTYIDMQSGDASGQSLSVNTARRIALAIEFIAYRKVRQRLLHEVEHEP
jgi:hypothetical protein